MVVDSARKTGVATHLLAWRAPLTGVRQMILDGAIGELKEVHNWTDRPFWPQQLAMYEKFLAELPSVEHDVEIQQNRAEYLVKVLAVRFDLYQKLVDAGAIVQPAKG